MSSRTHRATACSRLDTTLVRALSASMSRHDVVVPRAHVDARGDRVLVVVARVADHVDAERRGRDRWCRRRGGS
eukprot:scaffold14621_cov44-Phaeocystis_antarctica.AAC.3